MLTGQEPVSDKVIEMEHETTSLVKGSIKGRDSGKPVLPCSFGSTFYYDLCDIGSSINVTPYTLCTKTQVDTYSSKLQPTEMTIKLAHGTFRTPCGVLPDVHVILGTSVYPIDLIVMDISKITFVQLYFGDYS